MWRLLAILCLAAVNMHAAATEIRDTAYTAFNGVLFSGKLTITGPDMTTVDGRTVHRWEQAYTITNGAISLDLEPNDTATPAGTSYLVRFTPAKGAAWTERWIIPTNVSPLKVHQVRVQTVPLPSLTIQPSQISSIGAVKGDLIGFGTSWGTFSGGTDGQVVAKDSTQARGLKWADPDSGPAGPQGPAGADGAAGAQGPPGVVAATPPITYDGDTDTVACPTCSVSGHGHTLAGDVSGATGSTLVSAMTGPSSSYVKNWVTSGTGPTYGYLDFRPPSTVDYAIIRFFKPNGAQLGLAQYTPDSSSITLNGFTVAGLLAQPAHVSQYYRATAITNLSVCSAMQVEGGTQACEGPAIIHYYIATAYNGNSNRAGTVSMTLHWEDARDYSGAHLSRSVTTPDVDLTSESSIQSGSIYVWLNPGHLVYLSTTVTGLAGSVQYMYYAKVQFLDR